MKYLLWTHIATTGLDPVHDYILELYMKVTDMRGDDLRGRRGEMVFYSGLPASLPPAGMLRFNQPLSQYMHQQSGLLDDWHRGAQHTFDSLDTDVLDCLLELGENAEIWLAGYAPRFVYEFMRYATPLSHGKLHFQQLDVTSVEQTMFAAWNQNAYLRPKALRVRAKVDSALEQYRTYLEVLRYLANAGDACEGTSKPAI